MHSTSAARSVVTGASGGIGAAIARGLARDGHYLVLVGRDAERLAATADDCRSLGAGEVVTLRIDVREREAFARALADLEAEAEAGIGLFVACAGILDGRRADDPVETGAVARAVLETNLLATIDAVHAVLPGMLKRERGQILLIASLAAFAPLPDAPAYSASKAGLLSYGVGLGEALAANGIGVTVACPGYVQTAMTERHAGAQPGRIDAESAAERILRGLYRRRAVVVFPFRLGWLSRLALLVPTNLRRLVMKGLRFHVEGP